MLNPWFSVLCAFVFLVGTFFLEFINKREEFNFKHAIKQSILVSLISLVVLLAGTFFVNDQYERQTQKKDADVVLDPTGDVFTWIRDVSSKKWESETITVEQDHHYLVRLDITSDEEVQLNIALGREYGYENGITGWIDEKWNNLDLKSEDAFYIDYIEGSARFHQGDSVVGLSDEIVSHNGVPFENGAGYVTIEIEPIFTDANFIVENKVKKDGSYVEQLVATEGDRVEIQIHYKNTTEAEAKNVLVSNTLPAGLNLAGVIMLYNEGTGRTGRVIENITQEWVNIGNYDINGEAYIRFTVEVVSTGTSDGEWLTNEAIVKVGKITMYDTADVIVKE